MVKVLNDDMGDEYKKVIGYSNDGYSKGHKLANIAISKKYMNMGLGKKLIKILENHIRSLLIKNLVHSGGNKRKNVSHLMHAEPKRQQIGHAFIWGIGGSGVKWEQYGYNNIMEYLVSLRKFYKSLGYEIYGELDKPFLFYKKEPYYIQQGGYNLYQMNKQNFLTLRDVSM